MKLLTFCNKEHPGLDLFRESARRAGHLPIILGLDGGEIGHNSGKFGLKFIHLIKFLRTLDHNELIVMVDGFDVVLLDSPQVLTQKILALKKKPMLFSSEVYESPDKGHPYVQRRYLNAGAWAGFAKDVLEVLQPFIENPDASIDDQRWFTHRMFHRPDLFQIDEKSEVFMSMLDDVRNPSAGVLHFQGYYKDLSCFKNTSMWHLASKIHRPRKAYSIFGDFLSRLGEDVLPFLKINGFLRGVLILFILVLVMNK
jgi:hypothetical protein